MTVQTPLRLARPDEPAPVPPLCANCSAPVLERYCGQCGQKNIDFRRSTWRFFQDVAEDYLHIDSKLLRTFATLLFRPGELTAQYLDGKRKRFIKPFKVYLIASVTLFGAIALHARPEAVGFTGIDAPSTHGLMVSFGSPSFRAGTSAPPGNATESRVNAQIAKDPLAAKRLVVEALTRDLPRAILLLVPLAALLLKLLYMRVGRFYVEHFIFALHVQAFGCLVLFATTLSDSLSVLLASAGLVVLYLFGALRKVYAQPLWLTALKELALLIGYVLMASAGLIGVVVAKLYFAYSL